MNATPATVARVIANRPLPVQRPVYSTSTPAPVVAPVPVFGPEPFTGPCGCTGCEKWADCDYCGTCSPE
jgi:hypothetical protein